jgi:predicted DNA-binding transcriptional regulator YafY
MFTDEEALAISLGLAAARGVGLGQDSAAIDTVQAKLERVMPPNLRPRMRTATETVQLELSHRQSKGEGAALATMTSAAQARRRVHLAYRSAKAEDTERDFDPYGLVYRWGNWYVSGLCHLRGGLRSLRLDRIREVRMLDIEFARPADFDAARHLAFSMAHIQRAHPVKVLLKTDLGAATEELGTDIGVLEPCTDGVWLHSSTDDIEWFARQLARLPFRLRIMEPEALAQALRTHAQWLLEA